jgi:tryptophanyl-tRNA synthetase
MSKSLENTVFLADAAEEVAAKIRTAYTDPKKIRVDDPGNPDGCVVFAYHRAFNPEEAPSIEAACRAGKLGCVADKRHLGEVLAKALSPIRERRRELAAHPERVQEALRSGEERARLTAQATMREVREAMRFG